MQGTIPVSSNITFDPTHPTSLNLSSQTYLLHCPERITSYKHTPLIILQNPHPHPHPKPLSNHNPIIISTLNPSINPQSQITPCPLPPHPTFHPTRPKSIYQCPPHFLTPKSSSHRLIPPFPLSPPLCFLPPSPNTKRESPWKRCFQHTSLDSAGSPACHSEEVVKRTCWLAARLSSSCLLVCEEGKQNCGGQDGVQDDGQQKGAATWKFEDPEIKTYTS